MSLILTAWPPPANSAVDWLSHIAKSKASPLMANSDAILSCHSRAVGHQRRHDLDRLVRIVLGDVHDRVGAGAGMPDEGERFFRGCETRKSENADHRRGGQHT